MAAVLVISLSDLGRDPRVDRQLDFLRGTHRLIAAGLGAPAAEDVEYVPLEPSTPPGLVHRLKGGVARLLRLLRLHRLAYWTEPDHRRWRDQLARLNPDLVISNEAATVPLALAVAGGRPVVFDAHEYAPVEFEGSLAWRLLMRPHIRWICRAYLPQVTSMMAVSQGIAERYESDTGVSAVVVTNAPRYQELTPSDVGNPVGLVHFGWPDPQRRLQDTIAAMDLLGEAYALDLFLISPPSMRKQLDGLKSRAAANPGVRFLDPVPMQEIPRVANAYDIGVFLLPPQHVNQEFTLPNKFFEYIQGRIVPAIGPSPEMARLVREFDCGIVSEDFTPEAFAAAIATTSRERLNELKRNADQAARQLSAERNEPIVLGVVDRALRNRAE